MPGPLAGARIIELAGIGPVPFAGMLLADLGGEIVRIDRVVKGQEQPDGVQPRIVLRGRRSIAVDLKQAAGRQVVLDLVADAHALIEGFRPGVAERLGVGPDACLAVNPRLVYGRMTGWGQDGPLARTAGHDIAYIALTGALNGSRRAGERPVPPMNLVGDLGGGALYLALGVVSALYEAGRSGQGQVIDAAIVDGTASLTNFILGLRAQGEWNAEPGNNLLDTGAPFYEVYTCADGREIAVAPSSRGSTPSCCGCRASRWPTSSRRNVATTAAPGPLRRSGGPSCSSRRPATSGRRSSRAPRPALLPYLTGTRHRRTHIWLHAARSSNATGSVRRRPRPGSAEPLRNWADRRPVLASTPTRCSPSWVDRPTR